MINVTQPFLPPYEAYQQKLRGIWERNWLTNHGPLVSELESRLASYLDLPSVFFTSNGTIALQIAIKALDLTGEIITTPFSYVATTAAIAWEGCIPVMVDICPRTLTINPDLIEAAITPRTSAILATHVYGNACHVEQIAAIAARHGLRVIYDAAHAFGSRFHDASLYAYGDVSTASFHATKLFHTVEGGAVLSGDPEINAKLTRLRNFGHVSPTTFSGFGTNGKNSEFHAAMGLCNLDHVEEILDRRRELCERYDAGLSGLPLRQPDVTTGCTHNNAYYPVILPDAGALDRSMAALNACDVFPRRYFYPSLDTLDYVDSVAMPVSQDIARRVMCLPLYHDLGVDDIDRICSTLRQDALGLAA